MEDGRMEVKPKRLPASAFEDLIVWQKAHSLILCVYKETANFPKSELFGLTSQLRRAGTSISSNIAEGCGKFTDADLVNFLQIALGSSNEVEYLTLLSRDLNYWDAEQFKLINRQVNEVKAMLITLIRKIRGNS